MSRITILRHISFAMLLGTFAGCSSDDPDTVSMIESITPARVEIGDTITIAGTGLNIINDIYFNHEDRNFEDYDVKVTSFVSKNDQEIKVIVPRLVHERVYVHTHNTNNFDFELTGYLKLSHQFADPIQLQILDESTAFMIDKWTLYKSTDGWYTWTPLNFTNKKITSCFFLD